jgi:hypothetical protein
VVRAASSGRIDARIDFSGAFDRILCSHPAALVRGVAPDGANGVNAEWEHGHGPGMFIEAWLGLARQIPADVSVAARVSAWGSAHPADVGI